MPDGALLQVRFIKRNQWQFSVSYGKTTPLPLDQVRIPRSRREAMLLAEIEYLNHIIIKTRHGILRPASTKKP